MEMEEGTKIRVVRCPKCDNLLTELPDYTVYQCGGCGAVLRAKKQISVSDRSSEKSDKGRYKSKGEMDLSDASERWRRRTTTLSERASSSNAISSSSRNENREVEIDNHGAGVEPIVLEEMNLNREELAKALMGKEVGESKSQTGRASRAWGPGEIPDNRSSETKGLIGFQRTHGALVEDVRFPNLRGSSYGYGEPVNNQSNFDGPSRVEYLEKDRAELMRKLDELQDQLSRSCDMAEKPKERVPVARRMGHLPPPPPGPYRKGSWPLDGPSGSSRASMPSFAPDKHIPRPPYLNHGHEPIPLINRHHVDMQQNFHPPLHTPNEIPGFGDPFGTQMLRRGPHQPAFRYSRRSSHEYFPGHHVDVDSDPMALYPHNSLFDQAAFSCFHCYNKHLQVPGKINPPVFSNRRYPDVPISSMVNHPETSVPFGSMGYNPRVFNPPVYPREPDGHARRPILLDSDVGGFNQGRPQRMVLANWNGRRVRPIAGGAPFITCHNCFELLRLPKKLLLMKRNERKLQCGSCSTVFPIVVENKRLLLVSVPAETKQTPPEVFSGSSEVVKEGPTAHNGYTNETSMNSYSDEYDNSNYFKSTDPEHALVAEDQRLNLTESRKVHSQLSSSSSPSDDESSDSVITRREMFNTEDLPLRENVTPPVPGSPLQGHLDHPSSDHGVNKLEKGSRSKRLDQEKVVRQDSLKYSSVATEVEVSFNEYSNTGMSQDSGEASKEEDQQGGSSALESFFASILKKSYRDSSKSNQTVENGKANVYINGHPIPDRLVRKAEKLAGPVHPGQFWYDFRAGFWGLMGQPCLGIIPPFIEEFNYPMPENCAGGNTGVFVNGRELHEKDLDLLAGRGLPTTRDKSYIIEISGRVVDEDSGEELASLGKLAPTVEKAKRGFGMQDPKVAQ